MRLPAWLALAPLVCLAGCAGIWGFEDLTVGDGGIADATAPRTDASVDASGQPRADAADNDATQDAAPVTSEAQAGDSAAYEGGPDTGSCGPTSSILNCSACGSACDTVHSLGATCNGTTCAYVGCAAGWADCNTTSPDTDGCETPGSCGGGTDAGPDAAPDSGPDAAPDAGQDSGPEASVCAFACDTTTGTPSCSASTCSYTCHAGLADCNASAAPDTDGCETSLSSISSCAACGNACDTSRSTGAGCNGTTCTYTGCVSGWADCSTAAPDTNGCETSLASPTSCTACGSACDTAHSTGAGCTGTTCTYGGCASGYADCSTAAPDLDGCETSLTSTSSCGACGRACDSATGTPSCNGTTCSYRCKPGLGDCNAATAPDTDGCETSLTTTSNCGGCGVTCKACHSHSNGLGQSYYDCNPPNTYRQTAAMEACTAYGQGTCGAVTVGCNDAGSASVVCACTGTGFFSPGYCWEYAGPNVGQVFPITVIFGTCAGCPSGGGTTWN